MLLLTLTENRGIKMSETLSSLFQKSRGLPIEMNGRLVQPIFQTRIEGKRQDFLIRRLNATNSPVPGLRIKAVKGEIEVNGQRYPEVILWADTSPESVVISVFSRAGCELKAWNVWRSDDVVQAWVGNAGLLLSKIGKVIKLECSDGVGEADFSNLVIQIEQCD